MIGCSLLIQSMINYKQWDLPSIGVCTYWVKDSSTLLTLFLAFSTILWVPIVSISMLNVSHRPYQYKTTKISWRAWHKSTKFCLEFLSLQTGVHTCRSPIINWGRGCCLLVLCNAIAAWSLSSYAEPDAGSLHYTWTLHDIGQVSTHEWIYIL